MIALDDYFRHILYLFHTMSVVSRNWIGYSNIKFS